MIVKGKLEKKNPAGFGFYLAKEDKEAESNPEGCHDDANNNLYSYIRGYEIAPEILVLTPISRGYEVKRLRNSFKKFFGRYLDLIGKYQRSVKDMVADSFPD